MNNLLLEISIRFPHVGIELENLPKSITVFGFEIAFYGMIIAFAMVAGYLLAQWQAKRTNQTEDIYLDMAIVAIISAIIGARAYYVIFSFDEYRSNLVEVFNLRGGGLAIYGGIIGAVIATFIFAKIKKVSFALLCDTACAGLALGQSIGRWGNFFNREAFGSYTDSIFAMQLRISDVSESVVGNNPKYLENIKIIDGVEFIQVHPTFLYESIANMLLVIVLILITKRKKFDGEVFLVYLGSYGLIRTFVESLRTDQLLLWNTNIPISLLIGLVTFVLATITIIVRRIIIKNDKKKKK